MDIRAMKADLRSSTYSGITDYLTSVGDAVEPSVDGLLVWDNDRQLWFEVSVRVKDETKFDVATARAKYAAKMEAVAERKKAAAMRAQEKADKAAAKAVAMKEGM